MFRPAREVGEARKLLVGPSAESFCDVSWSGACRVGQLIAQREVASEGVPATDSDRYLPESIGQLPRDQILKPPDAIHARRESNPGAAGERVDYGAILNTAADSVAIPSTG